MLFFFYFFISYFFFKKIIRKKRKEKKIFVNPSLRSESRNLSQKIKASIPYLKLRL